jgi:hypothetical protein
MGARHDSEVVISPTIKGELGKLCSVLPRPPFARGRAAGGRQARQVKDAMRRYVLEDLKTAVLVETIPEKELVANFQQVRAKGCAMDVPCLKVVARKPGRQRGEAW